jgi:hypothetical protein
MVSFVVKGGQLSFKVCIVAALQFTVHDLDLDLIREHCDTIESKIDFLLILWSAFKKNLVTLYFH